MGVHKMVWREMKQGATHRFKSATPTRGTTAHQKRRHVP